MLAIEVERAGFNGLYVGDHPGSTPAPFVALAAAASVTERVRLGTCVLNAGTWEPLTLANAVATLDVVSNGRAVLGVGAGHNPKEWTARGVAYPSPGARVDRMIELVTATRALLGGEPVSFHGDHFTLAEAAIIEPNLVQDRVPLTVGGNGTRVLTFAAEHADVVGITGLSRTLADGDRHEVDWGPTSVRRIVDVVSASAQAAGRQPRLEALVQHVEITDDAEAAAVRLAKVVPGASVDDLLTSPFAWIGTVDEIRGRLHGFRATFGLASYVIRPPAMPHTLAIVDTLSS